MYCSKCGSQYLSSTGHCASCGAYQQPAQQHTAQPAQQAQPYAQHGQSDPPQGQAYPQQGQAAAPYSQANQQQGQPAYPAYNQAYPQQGQTAAPYYQSNPQQEQADSPYNQTYQPQAQAAPPYAQPYPQQGQAAAPYGQAYPQQEQADSPYGYTQTQSRHTYPYQQGIAAQSIPPKKSGSMWLKIAIPAGAVAIAAAAVFFIFFFARSPEAVINNALNNMGKEVSKRVEGTPLSALSVLSGTIRDNDNTTLTINYDYRDNWNNSRVDGSVVLSYSMQEREFAMDLDMRAYDGYSREEQRVAFEAFLNKERLAVGSQLFDNNYYGIKFDTFDSDVRSFADLTGMDRQAVNEMSDAIKMIESLLNFSPSGNASIDTERYAELLREFYKNSEQTSERVDYTSGGQTVSATKIVNVITKDALVDLLNDLYDMLESDEGIYDMFAMISDLPAAIGAEIGYVPNPDEMRREMLRDFRTAIRDFNSSYSDTSTITITVYTGARDRLMFAELDANLRIDGERIRLRATLDFGLSATDRWVFTIDADGEELVIEWSQRERSGNQETTITMYSDDTTITFSSVWSPTTGAFTLRYDYDDRWYTESSSISGIYLESSNGFTLSFDLPLDSYDDETLWLEIKVERGGSIKRIDYINIDRWDEDLLESLGEFAMGSPLGGAIGGTVWQANLAADEADVRSILMAAQVAALDNTPPSQPTEQQILYHLMGGNIPSGMVVDLWFDGPMAVTAQLRSGGRSGEWVVIGRSYTEGPPALTIVTP